MLLSTGRVKEGEVALVEAMKRFSALTAEHKDIPDYAMKLANTYMNLAAVWQASQPKMPMDSGRRALELHEELAKKNPNVPEHQEKLARAQGNLGLMVLNQQPQEAKTLFGRAIDIFTKLAHLNPRQPDYRQQLAAGHNNLGNALRILNNPKEAEAEWRQSHRFVP